jgi:hypothetical protein
MSSDPLAQADIWTGAPSDTEYDAVYAAVTATERGRWFLAEYANRNRHADTQLLVDALARIEDAVRTDAPTQIASGVAPAAADVVAAVVEPGPATVTQDAGVAAEATDYDLARAFKAELAENDEFAAAVAALASSLTLLAEKDEPALAEKDELAPDPQSQPAVTVIPPPDYTEASAPPPVKAQADPSPRWYIEPPDFVFHRSDQGKNKDEIESPVSQLPAGPDDDPAELFEPASNGIAHAENGAAAESAVPQLRIANGAAPSAAPRPNLNDSLVAIRDLSEEERIALFG